MKRHFIVAVACLAAAALLAGCFPGKDITQQLAERADPLEIQPFDPIVPAQVGQQWEPGYLEQYADGNLPEGVVGTAAGNRCPDPRPDWAPPCTQWAGVSGAYGRAAYLCAVSDTYNKFRYPNTRTCMDGYILQRWDQIITTQGFYAVDLYKYWRVSAQVEAMWWAFIDVYGQFFKFHGNLIGVAEVCLLITAGLAGTTFATSLLVGAVAEGACGFAMTMARDGHF